ncbi:MAG: hypothetical protein EBV00_06365 [Burkholderiaceae bacterium]|nr:hypothetical protein [Burkholderiaceae bacterium]
MAKKAKQKPNPAHLRLDERFITEADKQKLLASELTEEKKADFLAGVTARAMSEPATRAASVIQEFQGDSLNINSVVDELRQQVAAVQGGNMQRPEAMLVAQAHTLDALFSYLARRSHRNSDAGFLDAAERYLRLALKAQAQAVRTIEALGELKNPRPVTFVRQANVAQNQQVVNGTASQAGDFGKPAEQTISEEAYELLPNTRTQSIESATYPAMEAVGTLHRAEVRNGEG